MNMASTIKQPKPRFSITFEALPSDVPAINSLRRLLKGMLRGYGFKALEVREIAPDAIAVEAAAMQGTLGDDGA